MAKYVKSWNWKLYTVEFLSIFIAVISAFALNNWNDNRKNNKAETKILSEILNGLYEDEKDVEINLNGHKWGVIACDFWRNIINENELNTDTLVRNYIALTRDFTSIQNTSGYETLKSRGFELIDNDSLRTEIISLYEYDYQSLRKLEEEYNELQFQENYFHEINKFIAPSLLFDEKGNIMSIELPLTLTEVEKKIFLSYLWKIKYNRKFLMNFYEKVKLNINSLQENIEAEL